jgi:hypothetical protein
MPISEIRAIAFRLQRQRLPRGFHESAVTAQELDLER